jgi:hypothetical protein
VHKGSGTVLASWSIATAFRGWRFRSGPRESRDDKGEMAASKSDSVLSRSCFVNPEVVNLAAERKGNGWLVRRRWFCMDDGRYGRQPGLCFIADPAKFGHEFDASRRLSSLVMEGSRAGASGCPNHSGPGSMSVASFSPILLGGCWESLCHGPTRWVVGDANGGAFDRSCSASS